MTFLANRGKMAKIESHVIPQKACENFKNASENVVCLSPLLHMFANITDL